MNQTYRFLYHILKTLPFKTKRMSRFLDLLNYYHKGNFLIVTETNGNQIKNPLRVPKFLHLKASGICSNNRVILSLKQNKDFFIEFNFWNGCNNSVEIGRDNAIHMIAHIQGNNGMAKIGNNNRMEAVLYMYCSGETRFSIGNNNLFSDHITFWAGEGHSIIDPKTHKVTNLGDDITIGNNNWICQKVSFMKRAKITNGCIVGYGAVVTRQFNESNCAIAGNPATVVKRNILWSEVFPWSYNGEIYRELPHQEK